MTSYIDTQLGLRGRFSELISLYFIHSRGAKTRVKKLLEEARAIETTLQEVSGRPLPQKAAILEIGAGHELIQLTHFALRYKAVGIDQDVRPGREGITEYIRMWRRNGALRTVKTLARRGLGLDRQIDRELRKQLGVKRLPDFSMLAMDASAMSFDDGQFDAVYSRAVFEHLPNPRGVLREIRRVLKPGAAAFIWLHLYTSDNGCHDARIFAGNRKHIPYWAHLRPNHQHTVQPNAYLNRLLLAEWRELFAAEWPGSVVQGLCDSAPELRQALETIRAEGDLAAFTDEELLSITVQAVWAKPTQ